MSGAPRERSWSGVLMSVTLALLYDEPIEDALTSQ
jgi:hypothetical protein